jgi:hypothetical protein
VFNRFAVTREINDGLLAPRFAPSQRGDSLLQGRVRCEPDFGQLRRHTAASRGSGLSFSFTPTFPRARMQPT